MTVRPMPFGDDDDWYRDCMDGEYIPSTELDIEALDTLGGDVEDLSWREIQRRLGIPIPAFICDCDGLDDDDWTEEELIDGPGEGESGYDPRFW